MKKVGLQNWLALICIGIVGQFAWTIENMFLNLFIYEQTQTADFVPWMVAFSAAAATITTLLIGALSDKLNKRRIIISVGYMAWGLSISLFAFTTKNNVEALFPAANSVFLTGTFIIMLDCVMTFFGSSANDAAFNAYATDISTPETSNKIEAVLSVLPIFSMLIIFGGFTSFAQGDGWLVFFLTFGIITFVAGLLSLFLFPKDVVKKSDDTKYFAKIFHGFKIKVIKENASLYLTLVVFLMFSIAIQVFMPYFLIHIQHGLGFVDFNFTIIMAVVLLTASVVTIVIGAFFLKKHVNRTLMISLSVTLVGLVLMFFATGFVTVILSGVVLMSGYMVTAAILGAKVRDYTPRGEVGLFQGVRMVFVVLLPMIIGPFLGKLSYSQTAAEYLNDYNQWVKLPNGYIYLGAGIVLLLVIIPLYFLMKVEKKELVTHE